MDEELLQSMHDYIIANNHVKKLNEEDSISATDMIAKKYIKDRFNVWWWENLKNAPVTLYYGDDDGLLLLLNIVNNNKAQVLLFVTDDEPEPWPVFQGSLEDVIRMISEQRFFEYFITDKKFEWIVFDTHDNSLIVSGVLRQRAEKLSSKNNSS